MNNCPDCNHELVNIIYGYPGPKLVELAKNDEIALGGCCINDESPKYYCYGCDSTHSN